MSDYKALNCYTSGRNIKGYFRRDRVVTSSVIWTYRITRQNDK